LKKWQPPPYPKTENLWMSWEANTDSFKVTSEKFNKCITPGLTPESILLVGTHFEGLMPENKFSMTTSFLFIF
jgi:hypothetical protein